MSRPVRSSVLLARKAMQGVPTARGVRSRSPVAVRQRTGDVPTAGVDTGRGRARSPVPGGRRTTHAPTGDEDAGARAVHEGRPASRGTKTTKSPLSAAGVDAATPSRVKGPRGRQSRVASEPVGRRLERATELMSSSVRAAAEAAAERRQGEPGRGLRQRGAGGLREAFQQDSASEAHDSDLTEDDSVDDRARVLFDSDEDEDLEGVHLDPSSDSEDNKSLVDLVEEPLRGRAVVRRPGMLDRVPHSMLLTAFQANCWPDLKDSDLHNPPAVATWCRAMRDVVMEFQDQLSASVLTSQVKARLPVSVRRGLSSHLPPLDILDQLLMRYAPDDPIYYLIDELWSIGRRRQGVSVQEYMASMRQLFEAADAVGDGLPVKWQRLLCLSGLRYAALEQKLSACASVRDMERKLHTAAISSMLSERQDPWLRPGRDKVLDKRGSRSAFGDSQHAKDDSASLEASRVDAAASSKSTGGKARASNGRNANVAKNQCRECLQVGHYAKDCPKLQSRTAGKQSGASAAPPSVSALRICAAAQAARVAGRGRYVWLQLQPDVGSVKALADSGAECSVITLGTASSLGLGLQPVDDGRCVEAFDDRPSPVVCTTTVNIAGLGRFVLCVINGDLAPMILGRDIGSRMLVADDEVIINDVTFIPDDRSGDVLRNVHLRISHIRLDDGPLDAQIVLPTLRYQPEGKVDEGAHDDAVVVPPAESDWNVPEMDTAAIARLCADLLAETKQSLPPIKMEGVRLAVRPGTVPVSVRSRFVHPDKEELIEQEVQELVRQGILERAQSPWSSRLLIVPKADGSTRVVVDFRPLNTVLERVDFDMPVVADLLAQLGGARYFAKLDGKSAYFQLPLHPDCRGLTAIVSKSGKYQFTRVPQGACNSPAIFQRFMNDLLAGLAGTAAYLDDVIVWADSWQLFLQRMRSVTDRMREKGLTLSGAKCIFAATSLKILGYVVDAEGVHPDPAKVEALQKVPAPVSKAELRSCLGAFGFHRWCIPQYATVVAPLTDLLKDGVPFVWTEQQQAAFDAVKAKLLALPTMAHPRWDQEFVLRTDASAVGIGAVLSQRDTNGRLVPCAYFSKRFSSAESRYDVREQELLALVAAVRHWSEFLTPREFCIQTDHSNLKWLFTQKDLTGRLARWALSLQDLKFRIVHVPGSTLGDADMLSRVMPKVGAIRKDLPVQVSLPSLDEVRAAQQAVAESLTRSITLPIVRDAGVSYVIVDKRRVPILPETLREQYVAACHELHGHPGWQRTLQRLRRAVYWPGMAQHVRKFVANCLECRKTAPRPRRHGKMGDVPVGRPFDVVSLDIVGPLTVVHGYKYILTIQDRFSRYVVCAPLRRPTAQAVVDSFSDRWVTVFGVPRAVLTDRGSVFVGDVFRLLARRLGVHQLRTSAYNPGANGVIERMHRSLSMVLKQLEGESRWPVLLPYVAMLLNSAVCRSTGMSPHQVIFGSALELPFEVLSTPAEDLKSEEEHGVTLGTRLQEAWRSVQRMNSVVHNSNKDRVDRGRVDVDPASFGEWVYVYEVQRPTSQGGKFSKSWTGPYRVVLTTSSGVSCVVEHPQSGRRRTVRVDRLQAAPANALDFLDVDDFNSAETVPIVTDHAEEAACQWCGVMLSGAAQVDGLCRRCSACQDDEDVMPSTGQMDQQVLLDDE